MAISLAIGILFATMNVRYRDVKYLIPLLAQVWLFSSPVAYPSSLVPDQFRTIYGLNPMASVVEGFRWATIHTVEPPRPTALLGSLVVSIGLLFMGIMIFNRFERTFADII